MAEHDRFTAQILYYTEALHEVTDPYDEATLYQQEQLFRRIEEIGSPLELDTPDFDNDRAEGLSDDEIISTMKLRSSDSYDIFGTTTFVISNEGLSTPAKEARISILYPMGARTIESEEAIITYDQESQEFETKYYHRETEITERAARRLMEAVGLRPAVDSAEVGGDFMERGAVHLAIQTPEPTNELTQRAWAKYMSLLDMVAMLKSLGISSTSELNS